MTYSSNILPDYRASQRSGSRLIPTWTSAMSKEQAFR